MKTGSVKIHQKELEKGINTPGVKTHNRGDN